MRLLGWMCALAALHIANSAKILFILPVAVKSHSILYDRLIKELAARGHEITYLTPYKSKEPTANINEIIIPDFREIMTGKFMQNTFNMRYFPQWMIMLSVPWLGSTTCDAIMEDPTVKALMASDAKFDMIFGEPCIDESLIAGFSYKYNAPIVTLSTFMPNLWGNYLVGNPAPVATTPDPFLAYAPPLNFIQRFINFAYSILAEICQQVSLFMHNRVLRTHFGENVPCVKDILLNSSLLLVNHHPTLSFPRAQTPNTIDVGGMHIYPPKPLPKDLEDYMNNSKDGVILFSLGTNVLSSHMPKETIEGLLRGFGRMKENVLWKFEEDLENLPKNVKIAKWLPQSDILAHPKLKLFITHGGLLSTTEAVYRGVPIVGIPVMADQPVNMQHTENAGLGITLVYENLSEQTIYDAAMEVLNNPKYRDVAKEKSRQLRDTPMPALETAVWWIEFVLRHKGAAHLKNPSRNLWWYERYLIDVFIFSAVLSVIFISVNICIFKKIVRWRREKCADKKKIVSKKEK